MPWTSRLKAEFRDALLDRYRSEMKLRIFLSDAIDVELSRLAAWKKSAIRRSRNSTLGAIWMPYILRFVPRTPTNRSRSVGIYPHQRVLKERMYDPEDVIRRDRA